MKLARVAIVRGAGLSKWEMQIYEPLTKWFDLIAVGSTRPVNDIRGITFPVKQLWCPAQEVGFLPLIIPTLYKIMGATDWLIDFDEVVSGCDIVHTAELRSAYTYQAIQAKKKGKVRAVTVTVYENIPFVGDEFTRRRRIKEEVIIYADHFLAANEAARQALLLEGINKERISLVPQSVDTKIFFPPKNNGKATQLRKQLGLTADDIVVLSVGRMVWEKGWHDIVRAAHEIKSKIKNQKSKLEKVKFLCVGEGPELNKLKKMVEWLGLADTLLFTGTIPYQKMPEIFRMSDIFVLASLPTRNWSEQFGGVLIEAMASWLPIIGTFNGGIVETVGKKGGIFVPPQNFHELAEAIMELVTDTKKRLFMGRVNRKRAQELFDIKIVAQKIRLIWKDVLS